MYSKLRFKKSLMKMEFSNYTDIKRKAVRIAYFLDVVIVHAGRKLETIYYVK